MLYKYDNQVFGTDFIPTSIPALGQTAQIFINYFQTAHISTIDDIVHFGDYAVWIELYKAGVSPAHITGYFLFKHSRFSSVDGYVDWTPAKTEFLQNYPHPFNPATNIALRVPSMGSLN